MSTMNVSLPEALRSFVDEQVAQGEYGTSSEYVRELIRRDQERRRFRGLLTDGAVAVRTGEADARYFNGLRERIAQHKPKVVAKASAKVATKVKARRK